jgi:hypothetical protein
MHMDDLLYYITHFKSYSTHYSDTQDYCTPTNSLMSHPWQSICSLLKQDIWTLSNHM